MRVKTGLETTALSKFGAGVGPPALGGVGAAGRRGAGGATALEPVSLLLGGPALLAPVPVSLLTGGGAKAPEPVSLLLATGLGGTVEGLGGRGGTGTPAPVEGGRGTTTLELDSLFLGIRGGAGATAFEPSATVGAVSEGGAGG